MKLSDIMVRDVVSVGMDDTLREIRETFDRCRFHHLVVTDHGNVVGVISDRDLLKNISPFIGNELMERTQDVNTLNRRAHQIMTRKPVVAWPDMDVAQAAALLLGERVSCLPVVDEHGRLRGMVTWRDLLPHCFLCARDAAA